MAALRAYQMIKEAKENKDAITVDLISQGKLHPLVAYEYRTGRGFLRRDGSYSYWFKIEIIIQDEETEKLTRLVPFTCTRREAADRKLEELKIKYKNGPKLKKK